MALLARRELLATSGVAFFGLGLGAAEAKVVPASAKIKALAPDAPPSAKPTFVAKSKSALEYSRADNLFWNDIMAEHALFFSMLMPGEALAVPRAKAEAFQKQFADRFERSKTIGKGDYQAFNAESADLAKRFSDWKKTMQADQTSGRMHSLVWPLFFEHTAREADRFAGRLGMYNAGSIEFERDEVVDFWSKTMGEHAGFVAHLLDPQEEELIAKAHDFHERFAKIDNGFASAMDRPIATAVAAIGEGVRDAAKAVTEAATDAGKAIGATKASASVKAESPARGTGDIAEARAAGDEILAFKVAAENGINSGQIKSIIPPALAAHVRREAEKYIDELKRV